MFWVISAHHDLSLALSLSLPTHPHTQFGNTEVVFNKLKHGIPPEDIDSYDPSLVSSPPHERHTNFPTYHGTSGYKATNATQPLRRITSHDPGVGGQDLGSPGELRFGYVGASISLDTQ